MRTVAVLETENAQLKAENRELRAKVEQLEAQMLERVWKLEEVAEVAQRKRSLEKERIEVVGKLARHEITKKFFVQHGARHHKQMDEVNAELDQALAALNERGRE